MKYVEMFDKKVIYIGETDILPILQLPFEAMDVSDYEGKIEYGYRYDDGVFVETPTPPEPTTPKPPVEPTMEERIQRIELTSAQTQVQGDYVAFLVETLLAK